MHIINIVAGVLTVLSIISGATYFLARLEGHIYALKIEIEALTEQVAGINESVNANVRDLEVLTKLLEKYKVI